MSGRGARVSNAANGGNASDRDHSYQHQRIPNEMGYGNRWSSSQKCITEQDGDLIYNIFDSGAVKWEFM